MDILTALHNFATALVNRNSEEGIKQATHDLHLALVPSAAKAPATTSGPRPLVNTAKGVK